MTKLLFGKVFICTDILNWVYQYMTLNNKELDLRIIQFFHLL